jgi:fatty acid desaturase
MECCLIAYIECVEFSQAVYELGNWAIAACGLDPNWVVPFFIIIVGIGFSCTPSRADLSITGRFLLAHPGQAAITVVALLLRAAILFYACWPFAFWWEILLAIVVLFLPSWVACKVYVHFRP